MSYINRNENHYREVLSEAVNGIYAYYMKNAGDICDREGYDLSPLDLRDYIVYTPLFDDSFTLKITEEMPDCKEPDASFGKGNGYVCCKVDPESPEGKTVYAREEVYARRFLDMFYEKFNGSSNYAAEYLMFSSEGYLHPPTEIRLSFYIVTN